MNRQELEAFEQRVALVEGLVKNARVEREPTQLPVQKIRGSRIRGGRHYGSLSYKRLSHGSLFDHSWRGMSVGRVPSRIGCGCTYCAYAGPMVVARP